MPHRFQSGTWVSFSAAPPAFGIHSYPVDKRCPVSCNLKECMSWVLSQTQGSFERSLAKIALAERRVRARRLDCALLARRIGKSFGALMRDVDAFLLGRRTYANVSFILVDVPQGEVHHCIGILIKSCLWCTKGELSTRLDQLSSKCGRAKL
jgi:hypothetical protein